MADDKPYGMGSGPAQPPAGPTPEGAGSPGQAPPPNWGQGGGGWPGPAGSYPQGNAAPPYGPGYAPYPAGPPAPAPAKKSPALAIGIGCGVVAVLFVGLVVLGVVLTKRDNDLYGALGPACEGRPVKGAHAYAPGPGHHATMFFRPGSPGEWSPWPTMVPNDLLPDGVSDTELVVCAGKETHKKVGQCDFTKAILGVDVPGSESSFPKTRAYLPVRLVSARTGALVRQGEIEGPQPRDCKRYSGKRPGASDFEGDSVDASSVGDWLRAAPKP